MMGCQSLAVPAEVMQHVVQVESAANPFAIGVVGGRLVRQPRNLDEALATAQMLEEKGYNFSLGLAQVNRYNLGKYGLASYEQAFQRCDNLLAASRILADCYASAGGDWGKAFSCYYAGDFVTGYRDGYVEKSYASIRRNCLGDSASKAAAAIPLTGSSLAVREPALARAAQMPDTPAYRVAIRSSVLDAAAKMELGAANVTPGASVAAPIVTPAHNPTDDVVFVPQVRSPNEPTAPSDTASSPAPGDQADRRQERGDNAFVF